VTTANISSARLPMLEWGVRAMGCKLGYGCQDGAVSVTVLWDLAVRPQKLWTCRGTL